MSTGNESRKDTHVGTMRQSSQSKKQQGDMQAWQGHQTKEGHTAGAGAELAGGIGANTPSAKREPSEPPQHPQTTSSEALLRTSYPAPIHHVVLKLVSSVHSGSRDRWALLPS